MSAAGRQSASVAGLDPAIQPSASAADRPSPSWPGMTEFIAPSSFAAARNRSAPAP
jgi:hypothetical protein